MSFVEQEDIFKVMEDVIGGVFEEFAGFTGKKFAVDTAPFIHIPFDESMLKYGCVITSYSIHYTKLYEI